MKGIVRNRAKCRKCGSVIESLHVHDFVRCRCERIFVDGGRAYLRRGFAEEADFEELSEYGDTSKPPLRWALPEKGIVIPFAEAGRGSRVLPEGGVEEAQHEHTWSRKTISKMECTGCGLTKPMGSYLRNGPHGRLEPRRATFGLGLVLGLRNLRDRGLNWLSDKVAGANDGGPDPDSAA